MKILKIILIVIVAIIGLALIIAAVGPKNYEVQKEITINRPKSEVYEYVLMLKNQNDYSKWAKMDPEMVPTYIGEDGKVGFISAWEGPNSGKGEQEIVGIDPGKRIDYQLRFIEPFESTSSAFMITEEIDENSTKVIWGFSGSMSFPTNLLIILLNFEKAIGDDYQEGLDGLKRILENQ